MVQLPQRPARRRPGLADPRRLCPRVRPRGVWQRRDRCAGTPGTQPVWPACGGGGGARPRAAAFVRRGAPGHRPHAAPAGLGERIEAVSAIAGGRCRGGGRGTGRGRFSACTVVALHAI